MQEKERREERERPLMPGMAFAVKAPRRELPRLPLPVFSIPRTIFYEYFKSNAGVLGSGALAPIPAGFVSLPQLRALRSGRADPGARARGGVPGHLEWLRVASKTPNPKINFRV